MKISGRQFGRPGPGRRVGLVLAAFGAWAVTTATAVAQPATPASPPIRPKEARPDVSWREARLVTGRMAFVSGKVVDLYNTRSGHLNIFRVGEDGEWDFSVVIRSSDQKNFPEPVGKMYTGKYVRAYGMVTSYAGKPQVFVRSPDRIQILSEPYVTSPFKKPEFAPKDEITIATYNILNLFDDEDDPYRNDEFTRTKPRDELERVAERIRKLDADVIAFQEVESRGYLTRFIEVFLPQMGYEHIVHLEGNDLRGIDVCLASRLPVGPVRSYRHVTFPDENGNPMRFRRDLLCAQIEPPGADPIQVWVVHLKSKGGGEGSGPIRVGEARQIRKLLDGELQSNPEARIIVCGDFNDTWDSAALRAIVGRGSTAMKCFAEEIPKKEQISYNKEPYRSMIDFILCSPGLAQRYVPGSYQIHPGTVKSSGSDHNPVSARFKMK